MPVRSVIGLCLALLRDGAGATTGSGTSSSLLAVAFSLDVPLGHVLAQQGRKIQMLVELPPVPSPRQSHARLNRMRLQASVSGRVGVGCCDVNVAEHYRRPIPRSARCSTGASPRGAGCCPVRVGSGLYWSGDPRSHRSHSSGAAEMGNGNAAVWFGCHISKTDTADA